MGTADAMQIIVFRATAETFGMPDPPIPDGTILILVQDRKATLGRYQAPTPLENPSPSLDHPVNEEKLAPEVLDAVLAEHPGIELHGPALTLLCPAELAAKAVWRS
jgi:hypothetical protein